MFVIERHKNNPILSPVSGREWEAKGSFNWTPIDGLKGKKSYALYRAQSGVRVEDGVHRSVSSIAIAESSDGENFDIRKEFIKPDREWDKFGCEDPKITKLDNNYYIFYTGLSVYPFSSSGIRVCMAKTDKNLNILEKHPVTPFNAKAMALFPKKINGKIVGLVTIKTDEPPSEICVVEFDKEEDMYSEDFWNNWKNEYQNHRLNIRRKDDDQVELGSAPILTDKGWLVIYSHIQGYYGNKSFGTEALLLDKNNPKKIIARTKGSIMIAEEYYEKIGFVPNIIFPSGSKLKGKDLIIYYGATDTHSCMARVNLDDFLDALMNKKEIFKRYQGNPIISPRPDVGFEVKGTFNPGVVEVDGNVHIFYRAIDQNNTSTLGYARSKDGFTIDERPLLPVYTPREEFEKPGGCEDPRLTIIGNKAYMLYTAYDGRVPKIAGTSIKTKDLAGQKWNWETPKIVSIPSITDKDGCVLSKKVCDKYMIIHRFDDSICADFVSDLTWENEPVKSSITMLSPRPGMWDGAKVGLAFPPIEIKEGWLLFYHGVSHTTHYRMGVALLDKENPTVVTKRSALPLFEPVTEYEWKGAVSGVVFPCGAVVRKDTLFIYYGAADMVIGVASAKLSDILNTLL
jgi:predicted GH43/DUF377 family glycosyl hydrolase